MIASKNAQLLEAFNRRQERKFGQLLDMGADPVEVIDLTTSSTLFELICKESDASGYLTKCIENGADPNKKNQQNGHYPIHIAVQNLAIRNIEILLEADPDCANQTLKFNKTPLHLVAEVLNETNLSSIFVIIRIFSKYGGDFTWPARLSDNQTPFQMLLEKLATFQPKALGLPIIKFLIGNYPKIDRFQREKCARLMKENFAELTGEYQAVENWIEESAENWKAELTYLIKENEAEFLLKLDSYKTNNREELVTFLTEEKFIYQSILNDRFESFVEIYEMYPSKVETVADNILKHDRSRIFNHFLNHPNVQQIDPMLMTTILDKMEGEDIDPKTKKCFHILLTHPKYNVNETIPEYDNDTVLVTASAKSEYAVIELLKGGASLGAQNDRGSYAIEFIDNSTLRKIFDTRITTCIPEDRSDLDYYMVIDYSFLSGPKEMAPIEYMVETKDVQSLIAHPVISSFLFLKWLRLNTLFYLNLVFFSVSAVMFSTYLMLCYVNQVQHYDEWLHICRTLAYCAFIMFTFKEFSQFIGSPTSYLKSAENYLEMGSVGLMAVALFVPLDDQQYRRTVAAALYLAFAIEWTLIFSALPMFSVSNYIVMLKKVALNFLRTLAFYSVILLAFALSFYTLLSKSDGEARNSLLDTDTKESGIVSAIFHVVLMLTGEFGEISAGVQEVVLGRLFLLVFVFSMTMVMMNLLVGLTVSDTVAIQNEAEWHKWSERAKLLRKYERMARNCMRWLMCCGLEKKFLTLMELMPDYLPLNKIKVEISTFDSNRWIFIPTSRHFKDDERDEKDDKDIDRDVESDPFPLLDVKRRALSQSYFGCYSFPVQMDESIIEEGLDVLESNQELKAKKEKENRETAHRDGIKQTLNHLKRHHGEKLDQLELKLDQVLLQLRNLAK